MSDHVIDQAEQERYATARETMELVSRALAEWDPPKTFNRTHAARMIADIRTITDDYRHTAATRKEAAELGMRVAAAIEKCGGLYERPPPTSMPGELDRRSGG